LLVLFLLLIANEDSMAANIGAEQFPLERNGVNLFLQRWQEEGKGDAGQILLMHGLTFSSHEFDLNYQDYSLVRFLAGKGYSVWLLDIAGYGRSLPLPQGFDGFLTSSWYAAEDINAAVDVILNESGAKAVDLLGWSWGTVTASRFAVAHPEKVRKLILYAPILNGIVYVPQTEAFRAPEAILAGAREDFLPYGVDTEKDPKITDPEVIELFEKNVAEYDNHPVPAGGRRELLVSPDVYLISADKIETPTLVIIGGDELDPYVDEALVRKTVADKVIPGGAELKEFPNGGHALFMEIPHYKAFQESVIGFLAPGDSSSGGGGSGCSAGLPAAAFILAALAVAAKRKK
jgi:pimeloyl-ACP methyl ester carboxylesterase